MPSETGSSWDAKTVWRERVLEARRRGGSTIPEWDTARPAPQPDDEDWSPADTQPA